VPSAVSSARAARTGDTGPERPRGGLTRRSGDRTFRRIPPDAERRDETGQERGDAHGTDDPHYLLVGGGLQNCLIALLLLDARPDVRLTLLERNDRLGGNHTWSFYETDIPADCAHTLAPAVHQRWSRYDVRFPGRKRTVDTGYQTILSNELHDLIADRIGQAPHGRLVLGADVIEVGPKHAALDDGTILSASTVIDARGQRLASTAAASVDRAGYQKFVGLELELAEPGPYDHPIVMDACVPQIDGYRFFYVLPFSPTRVLVEETRFSDTSELDHDSMHAAVLAYADEHDLVIADVLRTESGVLPMPYAMRRSWPTGRPLVAGYAGGFLHPATGYSVPVATRLARLVVDSYPNGPTAHEWDAFLGRHRRQYRYAAFLNRLLFTAYPPANRAQIFEWFYRLPTPVIERFYRMELTRADVARIFAGRPPSGFSPKFLRERTATA
jgi:lycopene beta-cyclase